MCFAGSLRKIGKASLVPEAFLLCFTPLDLNDNEQITLDQTNILLEEEKSCLRYSEYLNAPIEIFEEELRFLLGDQKFQEGLIAAKKSWDSRTDHEVE